MKAFKKITAFAVAMTMGCSVFAFAACNPNEGGEGGEGASNLPAGMPVQTVNTAFASAVKEEKDYISLNYTNKTSGTERNYTKVNGVETSSETTTYEINLTTSGKINLKTGDADLVAKSVATYESTDEDKDFTSMLGYNNFTEYEFLRSWNMFSYKSPDNKEVTDFTGLELSYDGSANINWEEILGQLGSIGGTSGVGTYADQSSTPDLSFLPTTGDMVRLSLVNQNQALVNLAAAANTLKDEGNGVYSIDLIKTVDTVIKEVGSVVSALKGENTVGDILNNAIIKKYFSVITELVPVETVKTVVSTVIDALPTIDNVKPLLVLIQQDLDALKTIEASTTYDYIVSIVSSQSLVNIANTLISLMMSQGAPADTVSSGTVSSDFFTKTLDKYSINEILSIVNDMTQTTVPIKLQHIQNAYKVYVESLCDGEKIITDEGSSITELSVEYKLANGKLASQKINYAIENVFGYGLGNTYPSDGSISGGVTTVHDYDKRETQEGTFEITYDTSAPQLKSIDSNNASYYEGYEWDEEKLDWFEVIDFHAEQAEWEKFYVGAHVVDGEYVGLKLYDENYEVIGTGEDSVDFQVGSTSYRIYEYGRTLGDSVRIDFYVEAIHYGMVTTASIYQKEAKHTYTVAEIIEANS